MATQKLINVIPVSGLAASASITLPHGLVSNDVAVSPKLVQPDRATPIVVTAVTDTAVTFRNDGTGAESANFRCERGLSNEVDADTLTASLWQGAPSAPTPTPSGPTRPAAWGNEYLWWKLDDAPQAGATPNVAVNSGSAGAASLTATNNVTANNSNGGSEYDKSPMFGVPGLFSNIAHFRGSVNTLLGADAVYAGTTQVTLNAWANLSVYASTFQSTIVMKRHPLGYSVGILTQGGRAYYIVRTAAGEITYYSATPILSYVAPQMLTLTYDGAIIRGYLNGREIVSGAQTGNIVWTSGAGSEWQIGQSFGGVEAYDIWDVRFAASVRTPAQILADYKTGLGLTY